MKKNLIASGTDKKNKNNIDSIWNGYKKTSRHAAWTTAHRIWYLQHLYIFYMVYIPYPGKIEVFQTENSVEFQEFPGNSVERQSSLGISSIPDGIST